MIELNISGPLVTLEKASELLRRLEVEACLTATCSVCKVPEGAYRVEPGVHLVMPECTRSDFVQIVWPAIKAEFALNCGWMDASTKSFRGCTENYVRQSACSTAAAASQ